MHVDMHTQYEAVCVCHVVEMTCWWLQLFSVVQEVVDATLLEKVETSIESNKSLQMLYIRVVEGVHSGVEEAVLKGARGNTSLKKLTIDRSYDKLHLIAAADDELRRVRPELELLYF